MEFEWTSDIEDVGKVSEEKLELLHSEADKRLLATISSHDQLHLRAGILLTFSIGFTTWLTKNVWEWPVVIFIPFAVASWIFALVVIVPRKMDVNGYCPDLLYNKKQTSKSDKEFREIFIRQYGIKIVNNIKVTDRMGFYLNCGIIALVLGVVAYLTATGLFSVWSFIATNH